MSRDTATSSEKPLAIVGGGFAGTSFLIHTLLKIADDPTLTSPVDIVMIERRPEQLHRGFAYNKTPAYLHHNLNTGSKAASLFEAGPPPGGLPAFADYVQQRAQAEPGLETALTDPPRWLFGEYLEHLTGLAKQKAGGKARVTTVFGDVTGLEETPAGVRLDFADGSSLAAADVVLATGFQDTLAPKFARAAENSTRFLTTPYSCRANGFFDKVAAEDREDARVLIIGTGLTAMDCACRLLDSGFKGHITMMSRHSLLHAAYAPTPVDEYLEKGLRGDARPESGLPFTAKAPGFLQAATATEFIDAATLEFRQLAAAGYTSEEILGYWERFVPAVCDKIPQEDLAKLLSAHDGLITANRVGVTPAIGEKVRAAVAAGKIDITSGTICGVEEKEGKISCRFTPPGEKTARDAAYDYYLSAMGNTVGYNPAFTELRHPLWNKLMTDGKATPHWTNVGLAVTDGFALIGRDGKASPHISCIGVPVAGHMMVTAYPYPEKPGAGGRLGPASMNMVGITSGILAFLSSGYEKLTDRFRSAPPARPAAILPRGPRPGVSGHKPD